MNLPPVFQDLVDETPQIKLATSAKKTPVDLLDKKTE